VRQIEQENGVTTADTRVLWCETAICDERAADGVTVTRRAFGLGEQIAGEGRFFTADHLGSVREVADSTGTLLARYAFDPWGRRTVTTGTDVTTVGFTGHRAHTSSGLALALYRPYDAGLGRWLSEDPAGNEDGPNTSAYVRANAISFVDSNGLASVRIRPYIRKITHTTTSEVPRLCGTKARPGARGCANRNWTVQCDCVCEGGGWRLRISAEYGVDEVVVATDSDRTVTDIYKHEFGHIRDDRNVINSKRPDASRREQTTYTSRYACVASCEMWRDMVAAETGRRGGERHFFGY
jgi:RHS repeat-associated protein